MICILAASATTAPTVLRNPLDYVLIATFAAAALLMFRVSHLVHQARLRKLTQDSSRFWLVLGIMLGLFALVKLGNALAFVGGFLRGVAKSDGLYDEHRAIQLVALGLIGAASFVGIYILFAFRGLIRRHAILLLCLLIIAAFAAARFVSLHEFDASMGHYPWFRFLIELATSLAILQITRSRQTSLIARLRQPSGPADSLTNPTQSM